MNEYASDEERYFSWWLNELKEAGLITLLKYQPKPFRLSNAVELSYLEVLKTKTKERTVKLLDGHKYQADFLIHWSKKLYRIMFTDYSQLMDRSYKKYPFIANYSVVKDIYYSVIDVKGTYNQNEAWRRFSVDQKWVFQMHHIYVQKVITHPSYNKKTKKITPANALFPATFIPRQFELTDTSKQKRLIHYDHIFIEEFLDRHRIN